MTKLPIVENEIIHTDHGPCIGHRAQWDGGQYCALLTNKGLVGCGAYDIDCMDQFGQKVAIARGTPEKPLTHPQDLFSAKIVGVTSHARRLGIEEGMTGLEALKILLQAE
jgi:uncharacterized protein YunC (DUF1805 family)